MFNSMPRNRLPPPGRSCEYAPAPTFKSAEEETTASTASSTQSAVRSLRVHLLRIRALGLGFRHRLQHRLLGGVRSSSNWSSAFSRIPAACRAACNSMSSRWNRNSWKRTSMRIPQHQNSVSNSVSSTPVHVARGRPEEASVAPLNGSSRGTMASYWSAELVRMGLRLFTAFGLATSLAGVALLWSLFVLELRPQPVLFLTILLIGTLLFAYGTVCSEQYCTIIAQYTVYCSTAAP